MSMTCLVSGRTLLRHPVTSHDSGAIVGYVQDIIIDQHQNQVLAFLLDKAWRPESRVLPWSGVAKVTPGGVVARNAAMIIEAMHLLRVRQVMERTNIRSGTRFKMRNGRSLGRMVDTYFDAYGVVEGYAVAVEGDIAAPPAHRFLPAPESVEVYGGRAFMPDDALRQTQERPGAVRRLHYGIRLLARDIVRHTRVNHEQPVSLQHELLAPQLADAALHLAVGCRVARTIEAADGWLVVIAGQIVTPRIAARARAQGKARAVLEAVGVDLVEVLETAAAFEG